MKKPARPDTRGGSRDAGELTENRKGVLRVLKRLRLKEAAFRYKGWSLRALADHLLVAHQTVLYWNQGRVFPRLSRAVEITALLGCTLDELIENPADPPASP